MQPGWSCNLGGRATWVVVQPGWQPGWSCNLGGRGGCNGKETRQTSSEKKLEDVIVQETRRKPQSSRPFSAAGTLKVIPVNRSRGCHTVRTALALGTSVSLSTSARPCASVRQLSRPARQTSGPGTSHCRPRSSPAYPVGTVARVNSYDST